MIAKKTQNEENKMLDSLNRLDLLTKLRVIVFSVLGFITIGIVLAVVSVWAVGVLLILLGYLMIIGLSIKLLMVKKL